MPLRVGVEIPRWHTDTETVRKQLFTPLDVCVSTLRRGHANLLYIVPILTDDPRRQSTETVRKR